MLTFNTHKGNALLSKLIRFFSRGKYNHTSIQLGNYIYEAHINSGVTKTHRVLWEDKTVVGSITLKIAPERGREIKAFLEAQVGKKYDIRGIFSFFFTTAKPKMGYWYCSELGVVTLYKAIGLTSEEYDELQNVSPHLFWIILTAIKKNHA